MREVGISLDVRSAFGRELKRRVDDYFTARGLPRHGGRTIARKAVVLLVWLALSWVGMLVAVAGLGAGPGVALLFGLSAGLAMAGIGMAVQHDGGHGAFAGTPQGNRRAAGLFDLLGASSHVWRVKHGHVHHTYTNIVGVDDDISLEPLARIAPGQRRRAFHRLQHLYMWPLYGFLGLKWWLFDDFRQVLRGRVGEAKLRRPRGAEAWRFWGMKVVHGLWALVIPALVVGWVPALAFYLTAQFVMGLMASVVFQLAHCVEEAAFIVPSERSGALHLDFYAHQVATTVDFAPRSRLLSWLVGGLNFQIEHHLFPRVSHVHYPALAPIVRATCEAHGIPYKVHDSLGGALRSHYRWLRRLGRADRVAPAQAGAPAVAG